MLATILKLIAKLTARTSQCAPNIESMSSVDEFAETIENTEESDDG